MGIIFLTVFPVNVMPQERAKYLGFLEDFCQGLFGFTVAKEDVTEKEISGKLKF